MLCKFYRTSNPKVNFTTLNGIETQLTIVVLTKPNILILFLLILFQLSHTFLVYKELIGIRLFELENDDFQS